MTYYALAPSRQTLQAGSDASEASWFPMDELPSLAFDHGKILQYAPDRLRNKLGYSNVGFDLLPWEVYSVRIAVGA